MLQPAHENQYANELQNFHSPSLFYFLHSNWLLMRFFSILTKNFVQKFHVLKYTNWFIEWVIGRCSAAHCSWKWIKMTSVRKLNGLRYALNRHQFLLFNISTELLINTVSNIHDVTKCWHHTLLHDVRELSTHHVKACIHHRMLV